MDWRRLAVAIRDAVLIVGGVLVVVGSLYVMIYTALYLGDEIGVVIMMTVLVFCTGVALLYHDRG